MKAPFKAVVVLLVVVAVIWSQLPRPTPSTTSSEVVAPGLPPAEHPVAFRGVYLDLRDEPLPDHVLQLSRPAVEPGRWVPEIRAVTGPDGSFTFPPVGPGLKLLEAFGPEAGDMPVLEWSFGSGSEVAWEIAEGCIQLGLSADVFKSVRVLGPPHPRFWVFGRVEPFASDARDSVEATLQHPIVDGPARETTGSHQPRRQRMYLHSPFYRRAGVDAFLAGADESTHTLLRLKRPGFLAVERSVSASTIVTDVGTVVLSRAPSLEIALMDGGREIEPDGTFIEVVETGDDGPESRTSYVLREGKYMPGRGVSQFLRECPVLHECDRPAGRYDVSIRAPGYVEWNGSGDILLGEEPQAVDAALQPAD